MRNQQTHNRSTIYYKKGKGHPITGHQGPRGGAEVQLYSFSTSALGGGGWSAPRPGRFTPGNNNLLHRSLVTLYLHVSTLLRRLQGGRSLYLLSYISI
jgi:hypothetical protein